MEPRLSFVTLGVADVARARSFYERLGFRASSASEENVAFFDAGGVVLALFGRAALAGDAEVVDGKPGFSGVALAHNVGSEAMVDQVLAEAVQAGARLVKSAQSTFWGGYSGYFADPDGHLWEVAHNPFMPLDGAGRVTLPPPADEHLVRDDDGLRTLFRGVRSIAVVGASENPGRPSYQVMGYLQSAGFRVHPVNPGLAGKSILGRKVSACLSDIRGRVDMVDIFRSSDAVGAVVDEAIQCKDRLGLKYVWMQIGVVNQEAALRAGRAGLRVVMDRCPKIELARLELDARPSKPETPAKGSRPAKAPRRVGTKDAGSRGKLKRS